ncbi:MAG: hypothetical protein CVT59_10940 [Actinobacteria bacterium HGW-Actinobacteria-1]|jgi:putative cell wall-binding protein|nr:MAG: hypothetical protein CVT59_10940 [Actinobacteria bacterium HGW-Actinobacteria-1]
MNRPLVHADRLLRVIIAMSMLSTMATFAPTPAAGLTNSATTLDVGAGESVTLDGVCTYTTSVTVHDGGIVYVGASGSLTLKSPTITLRTGGSIQGTGRGPDGTGATIAIECTTLTVNEGSVLANGRDGTSVFPWDGRTGGSITVTATRDVAIPAGGLYANGGISYFLYGDGGAAGSVRVHAPRITVNFAGTITANGGHAWAGTGYNGGDGGTLQLTAGRYQQNSGISAKGGNGSSQDGAFSIGGDGGDGGTVTITADREVPIAGTVDVSGGLAGYGEERNGTPGAPGTVAHLMQTDAPYDVAVPCDGVIPAGSVTEYYRSWYWDPWIGTDSQVNLHQDGHNLYVGVVHASTPNGYLWLLVDKDNNGGAAPQTDDRAFLVGTGMLRGTVDEYAGNGSTWTWVGQSNWTGMSTLQGGTADHCEWQIPFAKLGIAAGSAKTMGMAIAFVPVPSGTTYLWPATATQGNPSSWPDLSSSVKWTSQGNAGPGGWSSFAPLLTNTTSPTCSLQVFDADNGLDISTAQYRYSTNGGTSWSAWAAASCTGSDGTTAPQTVSKASLPFVSSMSANRIQFRVSDMGGVTGESPQYVVGVDTATPTPWTDFSPSVTVTNTLEPDCTVRITDGGAGLQVASAQYQYSKDGGSSWSSWSAAACTGTNGTSATQTVSAAKIPFLQNSITLNKVRFRISDTVGNTATSGVYNVGINAAVYDLPLNGDFEFGTAGGIPTFWANTNTTTSSTGSGFTTSTVCQIVTTDRYHAAQSVWGKMQLTQTTTSQTYTAENLLSTGSFVNLTGTSFIDLSLKDCSAGYLGSVNPGWLCGTALRFDDGSAPAVTTYLYQASSSGVTDARIGTGTGADGATWSLYRVSVPAGIDPSHVKISVVWRVSGWTGGPASALYSESKVDWIRVVDVVPPASTASVSGVPWSGSLSRNVSFVATDYVGLASVQLWKRVDTGSGFGSWTQDQSRSVVGTLTSGTFAVSTPDEGRYEFYTRAVDTSGNVEAAPESADAWCGVDLSAPTFGLTSPSAWVSDLTPDVSIDVRDARSGLGVAPIVAGTLPEHLKSTLCAEYGTTIYGGWDTSLYAIDVASPSAPAETAIVDFDSSIVDIAVNPDGQWLFAALGTAGVGTADIQDPLAPRYGATTGSLGDVRFVAAGSTARGALAFAATATDLFVLDATSPEARMNVLGRLELPNICDMAFHNGLLYVACSEGSLWSVDLREPTEPKAAEGPLISANTLMAFQGDLLYLGDGDGMLMVYNVARVPDEWVAVTHDRIDGLFGGIPTSLRVSGDRLCATVDGSNVAVIDVGTPSAPALIHVLDGGAGGLTSAVGMLGRNIVTFNNDSGLRVWQMTEPAYRWSSDGGGSWSDWFSAQRSYPAGTDTSQTLTATRLDFRGDSATENVVEFAAGDTLAHLGTSGARIVRIDTTSPRVTPPTSTTHSNPASWYPATTVTASWSDYADLSGIVGYAHGWDDTASTVLPSAVTTTATSVTRTGVGDGAHYLHVRPVDTAGNWGDTTHMLYRVDSNAPTAPTGLSVTPTSSSTNSFSANWTNPAQAYAPLDACYYKLDAAPTSATDGTLVAGPPSSISSITASSEGTHTLYVWLRDSAGNVNHANRASATFVYDASAPSAPTISSSTHPSQTTWYSISPAILSWVATDSVSAIDGYSWGLDYDPDGEPDYLSDGTTTTASYALAGDTVSYFHIRARNALGLWSETSTFALRRDTSAPSGTMSINSGASATNQVGVTANSSVTDLSAITMRVSTDGGDTWGASVAYATSYAVTLPGSDGDKTVHVEYTDAVGHTTILNDSIILDTTPPSGSISINGGDASSTSANVTVTNAVTDAGPLTMRFSVNGKSTWTTSEAYASTKALSLPAVEGTATVWARFTDQAGNMLETSDTIVLDLTTEMDRIAGDNRYQTAALVSAANFPAGTCDYVVVATGAKFPDALGAAGLAGSYGCPLLLTDPNTLPSVIRDEIIRCGATDCFIIGSTAAVTDAVKNAIDAIPGMNTPVRLEGSNRYETAARVAQQIAAHEGPSFSKRAFIARGDNFADALASSPLAYATASPVLLVETTRLPAATQSAIVSLGITDVVIAGSDKAVSEGVKSALDAVSGVNTPVRVFGADRYATAAAVAAYGVNQGWATWEFLGIATGLNFPDALGGGAACGAHGGVLLLTATTTLSTPCRSAIESHVDDISTVQVFGGPTALSTAVYNQIQTLVE